MNNNRFKPAIALFGAALICLSPLATSHFDDKQVPQSYRQSYFALLALNFGPMAAMVKGEIPWNDAAFQGYADDLATAASLNIVRGFPEGSHTGQTRAKPEIWENMEDFKAKSQDMKTSTVALQQAAASGDKDAIIGAFKKTGGSCKACHDEYKSENYLN